MSAASLLVRNEGAADRAIRVILGLALLFLALTGRGAWGFIGAIPLLTGLVGSCPLYTAFGLSTCPVKR